MSAGESESLGCLNAVQGLEANTRASGALAFQTIASDVDIHLMDLDARLVNDTIESQPFSNSTRIEGSARFSPDESRIAFASLRSGLPAEIDPSSSKSRICIRAV